MWCWADLCCSALDASAARRLHYHSASPHHSSLMHYGYSDDATTRTCSRSSCSNAVTLVRPRSPDPLVPYRLWFWTAYSLARWRRTGVVGITAQSSNVNKLWTNYTSTCYVFALCCDISDPHFETYFSAGTTEKW